MYINAKKCFCMDHFSSFLSPRWFLKDHSQFVNCVRFSPDGSRFATAGADGQVSVGLPGVSMCSWSFYIMITFYQNNLKYTTMTFTTELNLGTSQLKGTVLCRMNLQKNCCYVQLFLLQIVLTNIISSDFPLWWHKWRACQLTGWREGPQRRNLFCK